MKLTTLNSEIEGPLIITSEVHEDSRGYFFERYNSHLFKQQNLPTHFCQENQAHSHPGVLRGMHYQSGTLQGKLVSVSSGKIFDVILDLRKGSPSFLKIAHVELDSANYSQALWIPPGFAHGYCVLGSQAATVNYRVTENYNPQTERGILWNDPDLKIPWPVKNPILSQRDQSFAFLKDFLKRMAL